MDEVLFSVVAMDNGAPPLSTDTNVTISINYTETNRFYPSVNSSEEEIPEGTTVGFTIHRIIATDMDEGRAGSIKSYGIEYVGGNTRSPMSMDMFMVDETTGDIMTNKIFDYDDKEERYYQILMYAVDDGTPQKTGYGTLDVYITDVNDNPPIFLTKQYYFNVDEEQTGSVLVGKVEARDKDSGDNARIEYILTDGYGKFEINETTGDLYATEKLDREKETEREFILVIMANNSYADTNKDYSNTTTVNITVEDINDNSPQFYESYETILSLSASLGDTVFNVTAQDDDIGFNAEVSYVLEDDGQSTDSLMYFKIDQSTGIVSVAAEFPDEKELDSPEIVFQFYIVAYDNGSPRNESRTLATVNVKDSSYNQPEFDTKDYWINMTEHTDSCEILPNALYGTSQEITYTILAECTYSERFRIEQSGDTVQLCNDADLDREDTGSYTLKVIATVENDTTSVLNLDCDEGRVLANELVVYITIIDINDNYPYFINPVYVKGIDDDTRYGKSVLQVEGYDADIGINAQLCYYPDKRNDDVEGSIDKFSVSCVSGDILTATSYIHSAGNKYTFDVKANDTAGMSSNTTLTSKNSTQVIVHILTVYEYCILVSDRNPANITQNLETIRTELEDLTGLMIDVIFVSPKAEGGKIYTDNTDMWFYAVERENHDVLTYKEFLSMYPEQPSASLRSRRNKRDGHTFGERWHITGIVGVDDKRVKESYMMSSLEVCILTLALVIFCGGLIAVFYLLVADRLQEKKLLNNEAYWSRLERMASVENPYNSVNTDDRVETVKAEDVGTGMNSAWIEPSELITRKILYEEQEMTMNIFQDTSDLGDDWSYTGALHALEGVPPIAIRNPAYVDSEDGDSGAYEDFKINGNSTSIPLRPMSSPERTPPVVREDDVVLMSTNGKIVINGCTSQSDDDDIPLVTLDYQDKQGTTNLKKDVPSSGIDNPSYTDVDFGANKQPSESLNAVRSGSTAYEVVDVRVHPPDTGDNIDDVDHAGMKGRCSEDDDTDDEDKKREKKSVSFDLAEQDDEKGNDRSETQSAEDGTSFTWM
ncbi:protocadherin-like wing polarity protein stan [Glandiceps talaboti]